MRVTRILERRNALFPTGTTYVGAFASERDQLKVAKKKIPQILQNVNDYPILPVSSRQYLSLNVRHVHIPYRSEDNSERCLHPVRKFRQPSYFVY